MDFRFTEEQEKFRQDVRTFLEEELKKGTFKPEVDATHNSFDREFSRKLAARGWVGLTWPKKYGGRELSYIHRLIYSEEMLRYSVPWAAHWVGERQVGPAILLFGTEEQKQEFLPRMVRTEIFFALALSEPNAGTDLAAVTTSAIRDGDYYVLNGQKIWTSRGHLADFLWALVRTDPQAPRKHQGLSQLMIPTDLPGITINQLEDMSHGHDLNEIFFDNVRVPTKYRVGPENEGWRQLTSQLDYERGGPDRLMSNYSVFTSILDYVRKTKRNGKLLIDEPEIRNKLAQLKIDFEVGRMLVYRCHWLIDKGDRPNYEAALSKVFCCEFQQRLANVAMQILGPYGLLREGSKLVPLEGQVLKNYLYSPAYTLQGGSSETLRVTIATRGFDLPRR